MSVFKKLDTQDFYLTDYVARKSWRLLGEEVGRSGIEVLFGVSGSTLPLYASSSRDEGMVWRSMQSNYYVTGSEEKESPFLWDSCLQEERSLSGSICVFSIPRQIYGTHVEPGTLEIGPSLETPYFLTTYNSPPLSLSTNYDGTTYIVGLFYSGDIPFSDFILFKNGDLELVTSNYTIAGNEVQFFFTGSDYATAFQIFENPGVEYYNAIELTGPQVYVEDEYVRDGYVDAAYLQYTIWDNGKGRITNPGTGDIKGDTIYNQGMVIVKDPVLVDFYRYNKDRLEIKWKSNLPIYTLNVNCRVRNTEMNHSLNPTGVENENGDIKERITGEEFSPYITTVGLYNERDELLMIGKMNRPVRKSKNMDMIFKISLDI